MALRRVFVDELGAGAASVSGGRARHLSRVVRLRPGEQVEISNRQRVFRAQVRLSSSERVDFELLHEVPAGRPSLEITLALAVIRFARFEWAIEKATELGVGRIVPLCAERSDPALAAAAQKRLDRWRRIAEEAAQQCRRVAEPELAAPMDLEAALAACMGAKRWFLDVDSPPLAELVAEPHAAAGLAQAIILAGPEGGWTEQERALARQASCEPAGMGSLILRAETAALASVALVSQIIEARRR